MLSWARTIAWKSDRKSLPQRVARDPANLSYRGLRHVLSDVLKQKDIFNFFNRSALEKAVVYQAQGRVTGLRTSDDLSHVSARVEGSGSNTYVVDIVLKFSRDRLVDIDGECSCPVSFNCKHMAATLFEALSKTNATVRPVRPALPPARNVAVAVDARSQSAPILPYDVAAWTLDEDAHEDPHVRRGDAKRCGAGRDVAVPRRCRHQEPAAEAAGSRVQPARRHGVGPDREVSRRVRHSSISVAIRWHRPSKQ